MALSKDTLMQLRKQVDDSLANPPPPPGAPPPGAPLGDFCSIWPGAKPILQGLAGIAAIIPGYGTTAAAALAALITVGDQIYKGTCS
jgi:hypothetical protein